MADAQKAVGLGGRAENEAGYQASHRDPQQGGDQIPIGDKVSKCHQVPNQNQTEIDAGGHSKGHQHVFDAGKECVGARNEAVIEKKGHFRIS
eukprot:TRINITY_DN3871_c0_g1_i1.p2 TRINITY_DN3871_c0_g1~~TRINITY_DN3871_c0_g1_i1.p2  ORF type:complete len:92 (+),score=13.12 TRINITY_DN3871_c0_g1_i1:386-661(+)